MITMLAPCLFGLEAPLAAEIRRMGGENVSVGDGRVTFTGDFNTLARANIRLRTAERVCVVLGMFEARSFTELFDNTATLPFEEFIGGADAFPVKGWSLKSALHSVPDCQSIIKKAAVTSLQKAYGQIRLEETGPVHQIRFSIHKDAVTIMLDTTGAGLHKRGYRAVSAQAPIKETLAAGIADVARVGPDSIVIDPMCGSGTLLIESALRAFDIAPGVRRRFDAEKWGSIPERAWKSEREQALESVRRDIGFRAEGFDSDASAVALTVQNAAKAGVSKRVNTAVRGIESFETGAEKAVVLCNPPYGERLLELNEAERLYSEMGKAYRKRPELSWYVISPHEGFEELFGKRADKRRKLYNGMIRCWLYMYYK